MAITKKQRRAGWAEFEFNGEVFDGVITETEDRKERKDRRIAERFRRERLEAVLPEGVRIEGVYLRDLPYRGMVRYIVLSHPKRPHIPIRWTDAVYNASLAHMTPYEFIRYVVVHEYLRGIAA